MERQIAELIEKEAIREQIYNYCRALDRIDNELGYSVFAEDSKVDYGPTYKGDGRGFIDMMLNMHRTMVSTHHMMTNILIKFNEDMTRAASEPYLYAGGKDQTTAGEASCVGAARCRDIDKWEKRDGKWVITERIVAGDNTFMLTPRYFDDYNNGRDTVKDPSYTFFEEL